MVDLDALVADTPRLTGGRSYKQVLADARSLLDEEGRWTQGTFARAELGVPVKPIDPTARCWCLLGAVARCSNEYGIIPPQLLNYLTESVHARFGFVEHELYTDGTPIPRFVTIGDMNDYLDHAGIIAFLDECIARFD